MCRTYAKLRVCACDFAHLASSIDTRLLTLIVNGLSSPLRQSPSFYIQSFTYTNLFTIRIGHNRGRTVAGRIFDTRLSLSLPPTESRWIRTIMQNRATLNDSLVVVPNAERHDTRVNSRCLESISADGKLDDLVSPTDNAR